MIAGFRRCVSRTPTDRELQVLMNFFAKQSQSFAGNDAKAWELVANDPANPPKLMHGVIVSQVAAWTATARLLLNLDETITRE